MTACKQNPAIINFSQSIFLSSCFAKFWNKNSHSLDILLSDTNVIFLPLGCGLSSPRYSLSSSDKTEEGVDVFKC